MKKRILLIPLCVMTLAACDHVTSSSSQSTSSSSSATTEIVLPKTLEEIKSNFEKTEFNGYSFVDNENGEYKGTSTFKENEIFVKGNKKEDGATDEFVIYKGYANNKFYDIEDNVARKAMIKNIVETKQDTSTEITLEEAKNEIASVKYNKEWFSKYTATIFTSDTKFNVELKDNMYVATLNTFLGGTKVASSTMKFSGDNKFISGEIVFNQWTTENFDTTKKEPIDEDQKPVSSYVKSIEYKFEEKGDTTKLDVDVSNYFVKSLDEFYVSSFDDKKANDGKGVAGKYLSLDIRKFSPSTALNTSMTDFKFTLSSNPEVIEITDSGFAKCLKEGTATVTIKDLANNISLTKDIAVETPALTSIWLSTSNKNLTVGDKQTIKIEALPVESKDELEVFSSANDVLSVGTISNRTSVEVTALKAGNATITVRSKKDTSISKSIAFVIKEKSLNVDSSWIVGEWHHSNASFDTTFTFRKDGTGRVYQFLDGDETYGQNASFKWSYDGNNITLSDWIDEDGYFSEPTKVTISSDKSKITIVAKCYDSDGAGVDLTMSLTKVNDTSWLVGTWNADDDDFGTAVLVFNADGTGTIKSGPYGSARKITWKYENNVLSFPKDGWTPATYWVNKVVSASKDRIVIDFEDDEGFYNGVAFTKAA